MNIKAPNQTEFDSFLKNHWHTHCVQNAKMETEVKWLKWLNGIVITAILAKFTLGFFGINI